MSGAGFTMHDVLDHEGANRRPPQRDQAIEAVLATGAAFWPDARGRAYCTLPLDGTLQRHRVASDGFRRLVRQIYGKCHMVDGRQGGPPRPGSVGEQALREALEALDAYALGQPKREPRPRCCFGPDGTVWNDLGRDDWAVVRISAAGWDVVSRADVPLIRPPGMRPLPLPDRAAAPGALARLRGLLNLVAPEAENHVRMLMSWLVAALYPLGPYPVLALDGEQGSGKTTASRMLRRLVDPHLSDLRSFPRNERDALLACRGGQVLGLDNLSAVSDEMADVVCRIATGAGFGTRALFKDDEEHLIWACNPVLLNGIPSLLTRGDLADRTLSVTLPTIPDAQRRTEAALWAEFDAAAPGILALLLDGLATALRDRGRQRLPQLPRMADFAELACAAAPAFGWTAEQILAALDANRVSTAEGFVEADLVANAVLEFAHQQGEGGWQGTATELLGKLIHPPGGERRREPGWPSQPNQLSNRLRRAAPALQQLGVRVEQVRTNKVRWVHIHATGN